MDDPPGIGEEVAMALAVALYRKGLIDQSDISDMAADLDAKGEDAAGQAAHMLRCVPVEADAPRQADWAAEKARSRFHVVRNDEG